MIEVYRDVVGYEGLYEVSNLGNVRSVERIESYGDNTRVRNSKMKNLEIARNGYARVVLSKDGTNKHFLVHRLVAQAFIPNPENYPCIDHINTVRTDNNVENLRWCTLSQNANNPLTLEHKQESVRGYKHSEETKRKMSEQRKGKSNEKNRKAVLQYDLNGNLICEFPSRKIACSTTNINIHMNRKISGGFIWKYKGED